MRPEVQAFFARLDEIDIGPFEPDEDRRLTDYPHMPQGTCYLSSRLLAETYPELTVIYGTVTFFIGGSSGQFDHAWCTRADGLIIDMTWSPPAAATDVTYWPQEDNAAVTREDDRR